MALLSAVYRLALRATQGLLASVLKITQGETAGATLNHFMSAAPKACVNLPRHAKTEPLHMVMDATGIKVYGKVSGKCLAMAIPSGAFGASCILGLMRPLVRSWRLSLRLTISVMGNYCLICLTRLTKTSRRSQAMGPRICDCFHAIVGHCAGGGWPPGTAHLSVAWQLE